MYLVAKIQRIYETTKLLFKNNTHMNRKKHTSPKEQTVVLQITDYSFILANCLILI